MSSLMWLFAAPFVAALLIAFWPGRALKSLPWAAFTFSLMPLGILLSEGMIGQQLLYPWLPNLNIYFSLQVDPLSLLFLWLVALVIPVSLIAAFQEKPVSAKAFYSLILLLQGLLIGFFTSKDLALFIFFWEAMLLPLYFMISLWGKEGSQAVALRFIIYMFAGSVFIVAGALALYLSPTMTFDMTKLAEIAQAQPYSGWIFWVFMLAFAVKVPLFPFHSWLPEAYTYSQTTVSILLSAVLSKAGVYGLLRVAAGLFPVAFAQYSPWLVTLAAMGVFYAALAALKEKDFKRVLAYMSLSHINFLLIGVFLGSTMGTAGALLQVVNHALTITALFLLGSWIERRIGTTTLGSLGKLAKLWPRLCWLTLFFVMSAIALPGLNNFVGEFVLFWAMFKYSPLLAAVMAFSIVLAASYMLRWMKKIFFSSGLQPASVKSDLGWKEMLLLLPLIVVTLGLGVYPAPVIKQVESIATKSAQVSKRAL